MKNTETYTKMKKAWAGDTGKTKLICRLLPMPGMFQGHPCVFIPKEYESAYVSFAQIRGRKLK